MDKGCSTAVQQFQLCIQEENSPGLRMVKTMIISMKMRTQFSIMTMTLKILTIFFIDNDNDDNKDLKLLEAAWEAAGLTTKRSVQVNHLFFKR